jgi:hypothetical protein
MTVAELIEQLMGLPADETVYRWDSERSADGTEMVAVTSVDFGEIEIKDYAAGTSQQVLRVIIS